VINIKTIYCYDEIYKEKLIKEGFKLMSFQIIDNKPCWLFENNKNINFSRKTNIKHIYF